MTWRLAIFEDEPVIRAGLEAIISPLSDWQWVGSYAESASIARVWEEHKPDLLLLDISLADGDGFETMADWGAVNRPEVIFITASAEHAIGAFAIRAVDYILKPFTADRVIEALDRAADVLSRRKSEPGDPRLEIRQSWLRHLEIEERGRSYWIPVDQVDWFEGDDYYARAHVGNKHYLVKQTLKRLEEKLDPERFFRIHKSRIVQLARVSVFTDTQDSLEVVMKSGARLKASRRRRRELLRRLRSGDI